MVYVGLSVEANVSVLAGREPDLESIAATLVTRSNRALLYEGPFGSGKSALLAAAATQARAAGARVLSARATESARDHAFGIAFALTGSGLAGAGDEVRALLDGRPPDAIDRALVTTIVRALAAALARKTDEAPVIALVDDAHLADSPSLELLAHLAESASQPLAIVATARPAGPQPPELAAFGRAAGGARMLAPLDDEAAGAIADRESVGGRNRERVVAAAAGNPFLLTELARAVARGESSGVGEPVPAAVAALVAAELSRLDDPARTVARAMAAMERPAPLGVVATLAGLDVDAADRAVGALADAGLTDGGPALVIAQPLTARAIAAETPARERARLHTRAAEILHESGAPVERVAGHLLLADRLGRDWAVATLSAAAERARETRDHERAVEFGRRALEEPPDAAHRPAIVRELGMAEADAAVPEAAARLREAMELAGSPDERARCALRLGQLMMIGGDRDGAEHLLARAIEDSAGVADVLADELRAAHAVVKVNEWNVPATERIAALEELSPDYAGPIERSGLALEAMTGTFMLTIDHRQAIALCRRALAGGALLSEESAGGVALRFVTGALVTADALELGLEVTNTVVAGERLRGSHTGLTTALYSRAWQLYHLGRVEESQASIEEALDDPPPGWITYVPPARAVLGLTLLERDEPNAAAVAVDLEPRPEWRTSILWAILAAAQARVYAGLGDPERALANCAELRTMEEMTGGRNPALGDRGAIETLARLQLGDGAGALEVATADLELARRWGAPRTVGVALRSVALATVETDLEAAIDLLRESRAVLTESLAGIEQVRTLVELGIALRRADQRRAAREPLAQAFESAEQLGLLLLARRAREELKVVGARPRRSALSGVAALTPAEHRAAILAAEGLTNRAIADELFVTVKAVEKHLGAAYGKLEIGSRRELAAALAGEEPPAY